MVGLICFFIWGCPRLNPDFLKLRRYISQTGYSVYQRPSKTVNTFFSFFGMRFEPRIVRITRMRFWSAATCRRFESAPVSAHSKESTPKNPVPVAPSLPLFPSVECFFCRLMFAHSANRLPSSFATANLRSEKPIHLCWDGT